MSAAELFGVLFVCAAILPAVDRVWDWFEALMDLFYAERNAEAR